MLLKLCSIAFVFSAETNLQKNDLLEVLTQRRTQSFTEGLASKTNSASRDMKCDSVISIYSLLSSSDENSLQGDEYQLPKSEVLIRKDRRDLQKYFSDKIDGHTLEDGKGSVDCVSKVDSPSFTINSVPSETSSLERSTSDKKIQGFDVLAMSTPLKKTTIASKIEIGQRFDGRKSSTSTSFQSKTGTKPRSTFLPNKVSSLKSSEIAIQSHRRNRSLDVNVKLSSLLTKNLDSQEYDIISDSELPSSLDRGSDEYLVVDGLIGQKVGSFTPCAPGRKKIDEQDALYHLRLGLFEILQDVLILLPDNLVTRLFGNVLKVEHLLVLVSQQNDTLRQIAVKVGILSFIYFIRAYSNA